MSDSEGSSSGDEIIGIGPLDMFTLSHFSFGVLFFVLFALFLSNRWAFFATVFVGVLWEPIEKYIYEVGRKWGDRKDSWPNLIFDVIFVTLGAALGYLMENWKISIAVFGVCICMFLIWYVPKKLRGEDN